MTYMIQLMYCLWFGHWWAKGWNYHIKCPTRFCRLCGHEEAIESRVVPAAHQPRA